MDWKSEINEGQDLVRSRKYDEAAAKYKEIIEGSESEPTVQYWAMKHFADLIGFIYLKDYLRAIDLYQRIINEYEEEDGLYEWCQVDMAKSYVLAGMAMFESYENMLDMLEPLNEDMSEYISSMNEKKEDFITERAEAIYKSRM